jgi:hypothetical protein
LEGFEHGATMVGFFNNSRTTKWSNGIMKCTGKDNVRAIGASIAL